MPSDEASAVGLLTRHFLRRLLDNDLVSMHADRHESLAVLFGAVLSLGIFVTFYLSVGYLAAFIQLPGPTALSALSDRFLYVSASMTMGALAALMVWEALALEPRDAAILGPLPIPARTITRAKLAAALLFGTIFALALNAVPGVLYPSFLTLNLRGMSDMGLVRLVAGHLVTVVMAGLFGFFGIVAVRGILRLVLGERRFRSSSSAVQSVLVVCAVVAVILAPTVGSTSVRRWISGDAVTPLPAIPVLWHLGVNEALAGDVVAETPVVLPGRLVLAPDMRRLDREGRSAYRALTARFADLARTASVALPLAMAVAVITFLWTNRRLPEKADRPRGSSRLRLGVRSVAERLTRADPEARAGFFFTWQTLARSEPHRLILAVSVAAALAFPLLTLVQGGVVRQPDVPSIPLRVLAIEIVVVSSLLIGFRYGVTVPAELSSNWSIRQAWLGDERRYLAGAKRAAGLLLVALPLALLLPMHVAALGLVNGVLHSLFGALFGLAALDVLFLGYRRLPFACSYLPVENLKLVWPVGAASVLLAAYGFAFLVRFALQSETRTILFGLMLGGIVLAGKAVDRARRRERVPLDFDEAPAPPTLRLGLSDRMAGRD